MTVYSKKTILAYGADRLNFDAGGAGGRAISEKNIPHTDFKGKKFCKGIPGEKQSYTENKISFTAYNTGKKIPQRHIPGKKSNQITHTRPPRLSKVN